MKPIKQAIAEDIYHSFIKKDQTLANFIESKKVRGKPDMETLTDMVVLLAERIELLEK